MKRALLVLALLSACVDRGRIDSNKREFVRVMGLGEAPMSCADRLNRIECQVVLAGRPAAFRCDEERCRWMQP